MIASINGLVEIVGELLDDGYPINDVTCSGDTALYMACTRGHVRTVRLLLSRGAQVNHANEYKQTPLFVACRDGHLSIVSILMDHGAIINKRTDRGRTPLYAACLNGHDEVAKILIKQDADVNIPDNNGRTPLFLTLNCVQHRVYFLRKCVGRFKKWMDIVKSAARMICLLLANGADFQTMHREWVYFQPMLETVLRTLIFKEELLNVTWEPPRAVGWCYDIEAYNRVMAWSGDVPKTPERRQTCREIPGAPKRPPRSKAILSTFNLPIPALHL